MIFIDTNTDIMSVTIPSGKKVSFFRGKIVDVDSVSRHDALDAFAVMAETYLSNQNDCFLG